MNAKNKYQKNTFQEIYSYGRPVSHHPQMSLKDRAKIFSPFAALRGHAEAVEAMQHPRCNRKLLSEHELQAVHTTLGQIRKQDLAEITYFLEDPGPDGAGGFAEGEYRTVCGAIVNLDPAKKKLRISVDNAVGWLEIRFEDIIEITIQS